MQRYNNKIELQRKGLLFVPIPNFNGKKLQDSAFCTIFADMNNLERHITRLLLNNDCVIVPGFGGFMAHHMNAYYNEEDRRFYPPRRTIGFNSQLKMNDSLLAQSYVETYDISYPEAMAKIEADTEELKHCIENYGEYAISGIGTLKIADSGVYDFEPCLAGLLTPSLFALDAIDVCKIAEPATQTVIASSEHEAKEDETTVTAKEEPAVSNNEVSIITADSDDSDNDEETDSNETRHTIAMLMRDIAVACVVLAAVLLIPSPVGSPKNRLANNDASADFMLNMMSKNVASKDSQSDDSKTMSAAACADSINAMVKKAKAAKEEKVELKAPEHSEYYTIVLASRVSRIGADRYVAQLHERGYKDATVRHSNGNTMVIYGQYDSQELAQSMRSKLADDTEFSDCWILHTK